MTTNVIICHGAYGHPEENWYMWLGRELEKSGCKVFIPKFPTPNGQSLDNWLKVLKKLDKHIGPDTILVGHSVSCAFVLKKIEQLRNPIKAAFLISSFIGGVGDEKFDVINRSFFESGFDWNEIKKNCTHFEVWHGNDDPYLSVARGQEIACKLEVNLKVIKGAGHFNEKAGYKQFPLLLKAIRKFV
jgi:hypothetical protein